MMNRLRVWFCRKRADLVRWTLVVLVLSPVAAWTISNAFAVEPRTVIVAIGSIVFAVWRPYRDSWLRRTCYRQQLCESR